MSEISGSSDGMDVAGGGTEATVESSEIAENDSLAETCGEVPEIISINSMEGEEEENIFSELEEAQKSVEEYHAQSVEQIIELNGSYLSEADRERVADGADSIQAVEYKDGERTGGYSFWEGKSNIQISVLNECQMERTVKHETNHFASKHREIIVPEPEKQGYTLYHTVGIRQSEWFHSTKTGENSGYIERGRGMNEGITTMMTNQQLMELSKEKGEAAERQEVYSHAVELCIQLEELVGADTVKEAFYGGNLQGLEEKVDALAGEKVYGHLRDCLDHTISKDYAERVSATKEAQEILAKMSGRSRES